MSKRYTFGYSDPRAHYDPTKWEQPPEPPKKEEKHTGLAFTYIGLSIGVSMMIEPMPWVYLLKWALGVG